MRLRQDANNYIFHACRVLIFLNSYGHIILFVFLLLFRTIDTASLEFGAAPEAVNQVQPALRLKVANIVSTPTNGKETFSNKLVNN